MYPISTGSENALDILLAVEQQTQKRAEEVLNALAWDRFDHVALEFLRTKIRETLRESFGKPGAKHDDKLQAQQSARGSTSGRRDFSRNNVATTWTGIETRTAMSGLSARTYSCGGEGSRFGRGGVFSLGSRAGF